VQNPGDLQGRAINCRNGSLNIGHVSDMEPDTGSYTQLVCYRPDTIEPSQESVFTWEGSTASNFLIYHDDNSPPRLKFQANDESGSRTAANISDGVAENALTLGAQVIDQPGDLHKVFGTYKGKQTIGSSSGGLGLGDISPDGDPSLFGADSDGIMAALHPEWISEPLFEYIWEVLTNRETYAAALERWTMPDGQGGLKRRAPDYLSDVWDDLDFWYAADRDVARASNEGIVQLPDFSGSNFAVQRTTSKQVAAITDGRGEKVDYIEFGGDDAPQLPPKGPVDGRTIFGIADRDLEGTDAVMYYGLGGNTGYIRIRGSNDKNIGIDASDEDGVTGRAATADADPQKKFAFVAAVDFTDGVLRCVAEDISGASGEDTKSINFTNNLQPADIRHYVGGSEFGTFPWVGKGYEIGTIDRALTPDEQDDLLSDLAGKL
jgi:hypothetical protein